MAVDVCSDVSSPGISPRISFSHDLKDTDGCGARQDPLLSDASGSNFDFCIGAAFIELSSAEELFSDGKILPGEIKKSRSINSDRTHDGSPAVAAAAVPPPRKFEKKKQLKEFLSASSDTDETEESPPPPQQRSFWQFNRSRSVNCDAATRNKTLIRSLHFLSRSNSTGSAPNPKNLKRQPSVSCRRSTSFSSSSSSGSSFGIPYTYGSRPPHKKHYGNGIKINPVLNFQPHICIGTGSLFGLGSLFCNGKVRRKKK